MRAVLASVCGAAALITGAASAADPAGVALEAARQAAAVRTHEALIRELGGMGTVDQDIRHRFLALRRDAGPAERKALDEVWERDYEPFDRANAARLKTLLAGRDWFRRSEVGDQAAAAAFHIVQHSNDLELQKSALAKMEPLLAQAEVAGSQYALLYDRIATTENRPQRYATQGTDCKDGRHVVPANLEDPAGLDERRKSVGLGPIAGYLETLGKMYGTCEPPRAR